MRPHCPAPKGRATWPVETRETICTQAPSRGSRGEKEHDPKKSRPSSPPKGEDSPSTVPPQGRKGVREPPTQRKLDPPKGGDNAEAGCCFRENKEGGTASKDGASPRVGSRIPVFQEEEAPSKGSLNSSLATDGREQKTGRIHARSCTCPRARLRGLLPGKGSPLPSQLGLNFKSSSRLGPTVLIL